MSRLSAKTGILTGASGGLGAYLARELARSGVRMMLCAAPGDQLEAVCTEVRQQGGQADWMIADVRDREQRARLVAATEERFGSVDILVNNAGVEYSSVYHELSEEQITQVIDVNLTGAMLLTRLVIPAMLHRGWGHIVNISSLAGKSGPAFQEPYSATKAGLTAFTYSLRGTYRGSGVSASVICPGFIETGIYARIKTVAGRAAPVLLGACAPERVARAVTRAIERDLPEVLISKYPVRPLLVLFALSPALGAWITRRIGANDFFRRVVEAQKAKGGPTAFRNDS